MGITTFIAKRLLLIIPTFLGVTLLTFIISHVVVANPVLAWAGEKSSPETIAAITAQYHLHDPIYLQYYYYMRGLFQGDWGTSATTHLPVLAQIGNFFPATVELAVTALLISVLIGIPMGVLSALWNGRKLDYPIKALYSAGIASPPFLLALLFQLVFAYYFNLLPSAGRLSPNLSIPPHITGMYTVDSLLAGNGVVFVDAVRHLILPAITLAFLTFAIITRITRASMLETMEKDFVRTAKAKGLPSRTVTYKYVLRNALTSTVTVIGFAVQLLLSGAIVVETIFFWPGIGLYTTTAILSLDFPSIMGVTIVFTLVVVFTNLITDLAYGFLDPRVTYD
ncbi:MAG: ABC transporter permease [Candidatus Bathyarchaeia archaeon]